MVRASAAGDATQIVLNRGTRHGIRRWHGWLVDAEGRRVEGSEPLTLRRVTATESVGVVGLDMEQVRAHPRAALFPSVSRGP